MSSVWLLVTGEHCYECRGSTEIEAAFTDKVTAEEVLAVARESLVDYDLVEVPLADPVVLIRDLRSRLHAYSVNLDLPVMDASDGRVALVDGDEVDEAQARLWAAAACTTEDRVFTEADQAAVRRDPRFDPGRFAVGTSYVLEKWTPTHWERLTWWGPAHSPDEARAAAHAFAASMPDVPLPPPTLNGPSPIMFPFGRDINEPVFTKEVTS